MLINSLVYLYYRNTLRIKRDEQLVRARARFFLMFLLREYVLITGSFYT